MAKETLAILRIKRRLLIESSDKGNCRPVHITTSLSRKVSRLRLSSRFYVRLESRIYNIIFRLNYPVLISLPPFLHSLPSLPFLSLSSPPLLSSLLIVLINALLYQFRLISSLSKTFSGSFCNFFFSLLFSLWKSLCPEIR